MKNKRVSFSWLWYLSDYHQNSSSFVTKILLGTIVLSYESISEQLLWLTTPYAFGPVSPQSITASTLGDTTALASLGNNQNLN